tara:strand:+ start:651 stop:1307 length:657 start_codon:yes stop_codon:yes gene_type:complete
MKKSIIFVGLILLLLLSTTLIFAQDETETDEPTESGINIPETTGEIKDKARDVGNKTEREVHNLLGREFMIPQGWIDIYFLLVGIGNIDIITWEQFIIILITSVIIFAFSLEILEFTAFETKWVKYTIAAGITLFAAITGTIYKAVKVFYTILDNFWYISGGLIGLIIILFVLRFFIKKKKQAEKLSKADELGIKAGAALKGLKQNAESAIAAAKSKD